MPSRSGRVLVGFIVAAVAVSQGIRIALGAFVPAWEAEFGASRAELGGLAGLVYVIYGAGQPIVGRLADTLGAGRVLTGGLALVGVGIGISALAPTLPLLFVAYLLLATVGFAATATPTAAVSIVRQFAGRGTLALGALAAAFPAGQIALGPLSVLAIDAAGWRLTLGAYAVFVLAVLTPLAAAIVPSIPRSIGRPFPATRIGGPSRGDSTWSRATPLLRHRVLWLLVGPYVIGGLVSGFLIVHFVAFAQDQARSVETIAVALATWAVLNVAGSLASGWLSERVGRAALLVFLYSGRSVALLLLLFSNGSPPLLFAFAALYGLLDFANFAPAVSLATERYGARHGEGTIAGLLSLTHSVGAAAGAVTAGVLREASGNYDTAIALSVVGMAAAAAIAIALAAATRRAAPAM
ncbi:MAG: MFS transporter [Candidatus Limnocylindria bacterium]